VKKSNLGLGLIVLSIISAIFAYAGVMSLSGSILLMFLAILAVLSIWSEVN